MPKKQKNLTQRIFNRIFYHRVSTSRLTIPIIIAGLVGCLTALIIVSFIRGIDFSEKLFLGKGQEFLGSFGPYGIIFIPAFGGLLVGLLITYVSKEVRGSGVPEVLEAIAFRSGKIKGISIVTKWLASVISIGSGSSLGREGPAVQIGSGVGSVIARMLKLSESRVKNLVACGAAAGISAVFNAPITGVMYALEILLKDFGAKALSTVVIASVAASVVSRIFLGESPAFTIPIYQLWGSHEIFLYMILGVLSALTAVLFIHCLDRAEIFFEKLKLPLWSKPALGGLLLGFIGFFFPQVFGMGFHVIEQTLHGNLGFKILLALVVVKMIGTSLSLGSGSSGGSFVPTLFVGAMLGGVVGKIFTAQFSFAVAPSGAYALVGMASVFAGAFHAPVTAILLVFEMTGDYQMILPIMLAAVISTSVSQLLTRTSIETLHFKRKGIHIESLEEAKMLGAIQVRDAMSDDFITVRRKTSAKELAEMMDTGKGKAVYVVNSKDELVGTVLPEKMQEIVFEKDLPLFIADDISVNCPETCLPDDPLSEVTQTMIRNGFTQIPVLDGEGRQTVIGVLKSQNIFRVFSQLSAKRSDIVHRLEQETASASGTIQIHFNLPSRSHLVGKAIKDLQIPHGVVLTSIRRKNKILIPEGGTTLKGKDQIWAVVIPENEGVFRDWLKEHHLEKESFFA